MFSAIHRRITYANVVATMALVLAMGGTAVAAKHYLVNSTKQINPKVLKSLKGKNGANGPAGPAGPAGAAGAAGAAGPKGETGAAGSALAYAHVSSAGVGSELKNVTSVSETLSGDYCIKLPFTPHNVQVTMDARGANFRYQALATLNETEECGPGPDVFVEIAEGVTAKEAPFWVEIN
jgi:hypothetical protein